MTARFRQLIEEGLLVVDGAMGSYLLARRPAPRGAVEEMCLSHPDAVLAAHLAYIEAGARVIETNSFAANRQKLRPVGLQDRVEEINGAAAKIARQAREVSGKDVLVAGSIGPSGFAYDPGDAGSEDTLREIFREQARALDARGVDLFMLETFVSLPEIRVGIEAVREVSRSARRRVDDVSRRRLGGSRRHRLAGQGRAAAREPRRRRHRHQLLARPARPPDGARRHARRHADAALRRAEHGRAVLRRGPLRVPARRRPSTSPGSRARPSGAARVSSAGAAARRPSTSRAVASALAGVRAEQLPAAPEPIAAALSGSPEPAAPKTSRVATMLARGEFVVSMQIDPPKGTRFRGGHRSGPHVPGLAAASMRWTSTPTRWRTCTSTRSGWRSPCEREGVETIPHVTPRDASLMGLCGNLLGAWSLGIRNVLVITGDPSQRGDRAGSSDVYQTDSIGLVKVIRDLNDGKDAAGNPIGNPPNFLIGVAVNPNEPDLDREVERFQRKVDHGADFAMTQVFFEWECWERFLDRFGGKLPIPALVAVWPLTSHKLALRIHHEVPGIVVPDAVLARLERAGAGAREEGFAIAREILAEVAAARAGRLRHRAVQESRERARAALSRGPGGRRQACGGLRGVGGGVLFQRFGAVGSVGEDGNGRRRSGGVARLPRAGTARPSPSAAGFGTPATPSRAARTSRRAGAGETPRPSAAGRPADPRGSPAASAPPC